MIHNRGILTAFICAAVLLLQTVAVVPAHADYVSLANRYIAAYFGVGGQLEFTNTDGTKVKQDVAGRWSVVSLEGDPETTADNNQELIFAGMTTPVGNMGYWKLKIGNDIRVVGDGATGQWTQVPVSYPIPRAGAGLGRSGGYMEGEWVITSGATIRVKVRTSLVRDQVRFELSLTNAGVTSQNVGLAMTGDDAIDGYTFIPGIGKVESDTDPNTSYGTLLSSKNIPSYFETYDNVASPGLVARNTLAEQDCTKPDWVAIGDFTFVAPNNVWLPAGFDPKTMWDAVDETWMLQWNQQLLKPGQTRKIVTYYGIGAASSMWTYRSGTKLQPDSALLAVQGPRSLAYNSTVSVLDPSTPSPMSFDIKAYVYNLATDPGPYELKDVSAFLYLPPGLVLEPNDGNTAKQDIGTVKINSEAVPVSWKVRATGEYSGELTYYVIARSTTGWQQIVGRKVMVPATKKSVFKSGWQLMNVPFSFNNAAIDYVFPLNLGDFRAITFDPDQNNYVPVTQVEPGKGFWMLVYGMSYGQPPQSFQVTDDAAVVGGVLGEQVDQYTVQLKRGWNMIGDPFVYPIYWGQVLVHNEISNTTVTLDQAAANNWISKTLFGWNPDRRDYDVLKDNQSLLLPWNGYWVQAKSPVTLVFRPAVFPGSSVTALPGGF